MTITQARRRYAHGTKARYHLARCRCSPCRNAARRYAAKLRQTPSMHLIDASPVTAHIRFLQSQGMSVKLIAKAAHVTRSVTARFVDKYRTIKRTRRSTMKKFLSVKPIPSNCALVRADTIRVLIERIVAIGYSRRWIAKAIGLKQHHQLPIGKSKYVRIINARRIHQLYLTLRKRHRTLPKIPTNFIPGEILPTTKRGRPSKVKIQISLDTQRQIYPHGIIDRYRILGCRCRSCVKAFRDYEAAMRIRATAPYVLRKRGNHYAIQDRRNIKVAFKSRSRAVAQKVRDQLNSDDCYYADKVLIDCGPVRNHLITLIDAGIPLRKISHASGIAQSELSNIRQGIRRQLRRLNAARLFRVNQALASDSDPIPATAARLAIEQIIAIGFAPKWLESLLKLPSGSLNSYRLTHAKNFARWQVRAILDLYANIGERNTILRQLDAAINPAAEYHAPRRPSARKVAA